jgi:ERCC4-related helicase
MRFCLAKNGLTPDEKQEARWNEVIEKSGLSCRTGRIDGAVPQAEREKIIRNSSVIIMTPEVVHAWLLSRVSTVSITRFLKHIALMVIDEAHTYSGVFGSNSAFLYLGTEFGHPQCWIFFLKYRIRCREMISTGW